MPFKHIYACIFNDEEAYVPVYGLIITVNIVIDLLEAKPSVSTLVLIRSEISLSLNQKGTLICGQYRNYL